MVSGGIGDDLGRLLVFGFRPDLVVRAAELERAASLEVLRLEEDARAGLRVELTRVKDRRADRDPLQTPARVRDEVPGQRA